MQIFKNYKDSKNFIYFIIITFLSLLIVTFYFFYIFSVITFFFIYVALCGLYEIYIKKNKFSLKTLFLYNFKLKQKRFYWLKYYLIIIPIQYSYLIFYYIYTVVLKNLWFESIKLFLSRCINIVFIVIFGFPVFYIDILNKVYARLDNSIVDNKINWQLLKINLNSMYFFDFQTTLSVESKYIQYEENKHKLN